MLGITTLVCTPMSAADRGYGVICADRGGGRFELSDGERHLLWTLGKTAALVATARHATRQQERSRHLSERLGLAREIHERVLQRLFGVSLALGAEQALTAEERERCRGRAPGGDRRPSPGARAPARPRAARDRDDARRRAGSPPSGRRAAAPGALARVGAGARRARAAGAVGARRGAAQRAKHAYAGGDRGRGRPRRRHVRARGDQRRRPAHGGRGAGMGLRLGAFEALGQGGMVEFGRCRGIAGASGWWCRWTRA